ncbi:hypothetical protein [Kitasatospora viridis]|uniref:Uncharacterized protein n=1 Tax=Kitasatospora viridis TaxID=281105 RepID=A0A561UKL7_9ACTN|nr:hypothetical protein [Kitasatospora viridis]TWF99904.1 hypothetical protein FHX73_113764 [Kitasatospora viridis]
MPEVPQTILDRISTIEDQLRQLTGRAQIRPALTQILGGDVSIGQGGRLIVTTPAGQQILYIGKQTPSHPDGSDQQGLIVRREDGSVALTVWTGAGSGVQPVTIWDHLGNGLFAEDLVAGGLAAPYIDASGWFGATEYPAYTTSGATFATVMHLPWIKQHPKVEANYLVRCSDSSTAGEIQLVDDSGIQIGPTVACPAGAFTYGRLQGAVGGAYQQRMYLHWQARTTSGSGTIGVKGLSTYGVQS